MLEHAKRDRVSPYPLLVMIAVVAVVVTLLTIAVAPTPTQPHTHPAADGIVTRAEIEAMLVQVNVEHAKQRAAIEAVHVRVDRLVDGVKAMAPQMDGRSRVPALIEEAGR